MLFDQIVQTCKYSNLCFSPLKVSLKPVLKFAALLRRHERLDICVIDAIMHRLKKGLFFFK